MASLGLNELKYARPTTFIDWDVTDKSVGNNDVHLFWDLSIPIFQMLTHGFLHRVAVVSRSDRWFLWSYWPAYSRYSLVLYVQAPAFASDPEITIHTSIPVRVAVSIQRCCLTSIQIPMLKIRRPHDRLIFNMGIPVPGKDDLYIKTGGPGVDSQDRDL